MLLFAAHPASAQSDQDGQIEHQELIRHYDLHLPPGGSAAGPLPLVVAMHGLDLQDDWHQTVAGLRAWWSMDAVADREGFAVVYPAAVDGRWSYAAQRPVPIPGRSELVDDLGFLGALIDRLIADRVADPARIYVTGPSRGGLMSWTMACVMPDRIAAAAPMITGMIDGQLDVCQPSHLVPLLALDGTADRSQPYEGWLYQDYRLMSVPETMEFWRRLHACTGQEEHGLAHRENTGPTRVALITWTGCTKGGSVQLFRIQGGGHQLPSLADSPFRPGNARNHDIETAEMLWQFFSKGRVEQAARP